MPKLISFYQRAFSADKEGPDSLGRRPHPLRDLFGDSRLIHMSVTRYDTAALIRQDLQSALFANYEPFLQACGGIIKNRSTKRHYATAH